MTCDLAKKQMIINHAELALGLLGLRNGQLIKVDRLLPLMPQLDNISNQMGIGLVKGDLNNPTNLARIEITVPDDLVEIVEETGINEERLKFRYRNNFSGKLKESVEQTFQARFPELKSKVQEALLQATNISRLDKALENLPGSLKAEMSGIRRMLTNIDLNEYMDSVEAYTAYLLEASVVAEEILREMERVNSDPEVYILQMRLHSVVASYKPILESLRPYTTKDSPIYEVVNDALSVINQAETLYIQTALKYSLDNYDSLYLQSFIKLENEFKERIANLDAQIAATTNPKTREAYTKRRDELVLQFEQEAPNRENIRKTLLGERGDVLMTTSLIQAGMANPDWIISGFMEKLNKSLNETTRELVQKRQEFAEALQQSKIKPGLDVQNAFRDLIQTYTHHYFDGASVQTITRAALMTEFSLDHLTVHSKYEAELDFLRFRQNNGEDIAAEKETLVKEFRDWRLGTYESKYSDEYYAADKLLDLEVDGRTVREYRDDIVKQMSALQSEIRYNGYFPTADQIRRKRELNSELKKLKSFNGKQPGSTEFKVAQVLQEHGELMKTMVKYEMTPRAQDNFNKALADVRSQLSRGLITQEEHDLWVDSNTRTTYTQDYFDQITEIFKNIEGVRDRYAAYTGITIQKVDVYETLRRESNPYRDEDGIIDATLMPADLRQKLIDMQKDLMKKLRDEVGMSGLTKNERAELSDLYKRKDIIYAKLSADKNNQQLKDLYEDIKSKIDVIKEKKVKDQYILDLQAELSKYYDQLNILNTVSSTPYYDQEYEYQMDLFIRDKTISANPDFTFSFDGMTYTYEEDRWIARDKYEEITLDDDEIMNVWLSYQEKQFTQSQWYQDNHIEIEVFDPIAKEYITRYQRAYVWSHTKPRDENQILDMEPSFHWQERVVTALNPNFKKDVKGRAMPKNPARNPNYPTDQDKLTYLKFLTDQYLAYQESVPSGQRMGYDLPSIERSQNLVDTLLNFDAKRIGEQLTREIFTNEQDKDEAYGDTTNRMIQYQPMMFSGQLEENLINMNLHETLLRYIGQAIKYQKVQDQVIPLASATEAVLSQHSPVTDVMNKSAAKLGFMKRLSKPADDNSRLKVFREMVNTFVYNETEYASVGYTVNENTFVLGRFKGLIGKNVRFEKVFNKLLGFRAASLMFGSVFPQIANLWNGQIQQIIQSAGGKGRLSFTLRQWWRATYKFNSTYVGQYIRDMHSPGNKSKFTLMMDYFNAIPLDLLNTVGYELDQNGIRKLMSSDIGFLVKNSVEFSLAGTTFLAMAESWMYEGKSMWNNFEVVNGRLEGNVPPAEMDRFIKALNIANREINGNYSKIDKTIAEKYWYGRAVFFMKKFIVPFVQRRYGKRRYSNEYEDYIEGYHRTAFKMLLNSVKNFRDGLGAKSLPATYDMLTDAERSGIKMFLAEMFIVATLITASSLMFDDDDEDRFKDLEQESFAYQVFLFSLMKTKTEVETFVIPFGINEVDKLKGRALDELFPTLSQFMDVVKSIDYDDMEFKKYKTSTPSADKGDLVITHKLMKFVGWNRSKFDPIVGIRNIDAASRQ